MASEVVAEDVSVWNIASNLCSSCLDGNYENCYCDDEERLEKDLSCDSLDGDGDEECSDAEDEDEEDDEEGATQTKQKRNSIYDEYISDDEFHDNEDEDENVQLPPSTTDWDSIDSVLEKELEDTGEGEEGGLSKRLSHNVNMQMVFVESEESDKASDPDVEVYYDDNLDSTKNNSGSIDDLSFTDRNVDSRDSGYLTTDVTDMNFERVTESKRRNSSTEPVDESARILASLKLHQEYEEKLNGETQIKNEQEKEFIDEVHQKNVDELRTMKEFLELHIAKINYELLEQLEIRDYLYSNHESLLMDADDLAKLSTEDGSSTTTITTTTTTTTTTITTTPTTTTTTPTGTQAESSDTNPVTEPPDPKSPNHMAPTRSRAPKRKSFWWR